MTFLSPTMLWGLLAASIPVIIHLISLRNTKEIEFSSIRFIEGLKHETIRKLKIKQWILILLRTAIIISLVLVVSRPATEGLIPGWMAGEAESRAIILIDNSASMSLKTERRSLLEKSKLLAKSLISNLDKNTSIEIFQTNPRKQIYEGKKERVQSISNAINGINQSTLPDHIWEKLISVLIEVEENELNKECFIFSDIQTVPDTTSINALKSDELNDWLIYFIGQETVTDNIAIYEVFPASQVKLSDHLMKLNTLVTNEGKNEKRNVPIELYLNEERVGQVVTGFKPGKAKEFLFQVYPGKSGIVRGQMTIPDDDFAFDNQQSFDLSIPEEISCMLVGRSVEDVLLIEEALKSISGDKEYISIHRKIKPHIDKLFLDDSDVLILHRPVNISTQAVEEIQRFTARGGGIIWLADASEEFFIDENIETALKLPEYIQYISTEGESYFSVRQPENQHALFAGFIIRKIKSELPEIFQYSRVRPRLNQNVILSLHNGDPYLLEYRLIGGHVYYFTSPIGLAWNDMALRGLFVPLLHRLLIMLATDESNTMPLVIGQPKEINIPKELINAVWEMFTPSGKRTLLIPDYNREILIIENLDELGSYEIYSDNNLYTAFSTQMDPNERPVNRVPGSIISELIGTDRTQFIESDQNITEVLKALRYGKALWRSFLLLTIFLLLLESVISKPDVKSMKSNDG